MNKKDSGLTTVTPILTDKIRGLDDPGGTPTSVTFLLSAVYDLFKTSYDAVYASLTGTQILTNKRKVPRSVTVTQHATPTYNTDNGDVFVISGLAQAITSLTTNKTGTPNDWEFMAMYLKDDGTARAITPGGDFVGTDNNSLTGLTTTANKWLYLLWQWNPVSTKWVLMAKDRDA